MKHELLLDNLPLLMQVCSGLYGILDSHVNRYNIRRDAIRGIALAVVDDPEARVWLSGSRIAELRHQTITATRVGGNWFIGSVTDLLLIHLQGITGANIELDSCLRRCPNISIAGVLGTHRHRLPNKENVAIRRPIKISPVEGRLVARDLWGA